MLTHRLAKRQSIYPLQIIPKRGTPGFMLEQLDILHEKLRKIDEELIKPTETML